MKKSANKNVSMLSDERLSALFYQLSLMTRAGISMEEGLLLLLGDADVQERGLLGAMHNRLAAGAPLSTAMADSGLFPAYALSMLSIGELAGRQEEVLTALSVFYRREQQMKRSIHQALVYPAVMSVLVGGVFLVLISRVLPVFSGVFSQLGLRLSPAAAMLLRLGTVSQHLAGAFSALLLLAVCILFVLFRRGIITESSFVRGETALNVARSRFASAMALMLSSGLPIDDALERVRDMLADTPLSAKIQDCTARLAAGESFPQAAAQCGLFPALENGLLAAGFRAGLSDQAMEELARRSEEQAEARLSRFLSHFQYGLVTLLCVAVGLVLLSVMLPLLGVLAAIGA